MDFDGEVIIGDGHRHNEWPIHGEILKRRPDLNFTGHTHAFYSVIFSSISEPLRSINGALGSTPCRYEGSTELVVTPDAGARLAEVLGDAVILFMRNHGVVFCGATLMQLSRNGIGVEETCRQMLTANGSGLAWSWPDKQEQTRKVGNTGRLYRGDMLWNYYCRVLARAEARGEPSLATEPVLDE